MPLRNLRDIVPETDLMHLPGTSRLGLGALRNGVSRCTEPLSRCTWQVHQVEILDVPVPGTLIGIAANRYLVPVH